MIRLAPILCGLLAACAAAPPAPSVITSSAPSTTVQTPVAVSCVDPADIPLEHPTAIPARGADVARLAAGASADVRQLRADNAKLRAMLLACATTTK